MKENLIKDKTFQFSLSVIELYKIMIAQNEYVLSKQLLKAATSIGANVVEAGAAQSRKDFLSKMSIASKEARETQYWLMLLEGSGLVSVEMKSYLEEVESIIRILTSIVKSTSEQI